MLTGNDFEVKCTPLRRENSSAGRAQPCQGWGREFEPPFSLQIQKTSVQLTEVFYISASLEAMKLNLG